LPVKLEAEGSQNEKSLAPWTVPGDTLIERLAFTHFVELIKTDDPPKRSFYEIECIRGNWSVRELKRQINSLYYERSGLSKDKEKHYRFTTDLKLQLICNEKLIEKAAAAVQASSQKPAALIVPDRFKSLPISNCNEVKWDADTPL